MKTTTRLSGRPVADWRALLMWGCVAGFYAYQFVMRVSPGVMIDDLMTEFSTTASDIGEMASSYLVFYSLLQIPAGMMMDRWGARRIITGALVLLLAGTWLFAHAGSMNGATAGRILIGAGSAPAFIGCSWVIHHWFPRRQVNMMLSLTMTVGIVGAVNGGVPLAWAIRNHGWRSSVEGVTLLGVAFLGLFLLLFRDQPASGSSGNPEPSAPPPAPGTVLQSLKKVLGIGQVWITATAAFGMYLPLSVFGDLWGVNYLVRVLGFDPMEAAGSTSLIYAGTAFGAPFGAWLANRLGSRRRSILVHSLVMLGALSLLLCLNLPHRAVQGLVFLTGFCIGSEVLCFALCCQHVSRSMTGLTTGVVNTITMAGGAVLQSLVGQCLDALWDGKRDAAGLPFYSPASYRLSLGVMVLCLFVSVVCLLKVKEPEHTDHHS